MKNMNERLVDSLRQVCGGRHILIGEKETAKYVCDFLGGHRGRARAVALPSSVEEVQDIVRLCGQAKVPIVPQGGNTGYRAGGVPDDSGDMVVLSMNRMRAAPHIDEAAAIMTAAGGCVLEDLQTVAADSGWFLPFTLGARGTCHIGGNMATNAGGMHFVRYGGARELCAGLEAVLPSGEKILLQSGARKNNTGYDLKNLLIGSEGTLAVITSVSLKLLRPPKTRALAYAVVHRLEDAQALLALCQKNTAGHVETFELMPRILWELLQKHFPDNPQPFADRPTMAVLVEIAADEAANVLLQTALESALAAGLIDDAVLPSSETQSARFWQLRELAPEATRREGEWLKMDVCLPLSALSDFAAAAKDILKAEDAAGTHIVLFGHLGDGNLHLSLRPNNQPPSANPALSSRLKKMLLDEVHARQGSFSAEHGIGRTQLDLMVRYQDAGALSAMRAIKKSLDPSNIMNPGVLLPDA